jgi:phytoene dehydrogenase-like protein
MTKYDAIVIGSGPNGLSAAIKLAQEGLAVKIFEAKLTAGGGMRTEELTLPGFRHDICSAIHPLAAASPFIKTLPLEKFGLKWIFPPAAFAHPFEDGSVILLNNSVDETAKHLGEDGDNYKKLMNPLVKNWDKIDRDLLGPVGFPEHPIHYLKFGMKAILPANLLSKIYFKTGKAKGFFSGMAAHSVVPLNSPFTAAMGLVLAITGHKPGWPLPRGGAKSISNAMSACFISLGGEIETGREISSMKDLPESKIFLFDVTPKQLIKICGEELSGFYKWRLKRYRYGPGVFKIDWALSERIPWKSKECYKSATVHLCGKYEEVAESEKTIWSGIHPTRPFVLLAQQSVFDDSRAPEGKHTAWGYCHVPNGSTQDMTPIIEAQVERFAPGFKDIILKRHVMNTSDMEDHNPNFIGGDVLGGAQDWKQLFARPLLKLNPYLTSNKKIYICSASTPPGGGVHGMCGYHAAVRVLKNLELNLPGF